VNVRRDCCHSAYTIDREGVRTDYLYDKINRLVSSSRLGIISSNQFDLADRLTSLRRKGTDGTLITQSSKTYDMAGRVLTENNALNGPTTYSEKMTNSQRLQVITYPTVALARICFTAMATGQSDRHWHLPDPLRIRPAVGTEAWFGPFVKEIKLDASGADTQEWTTNYTDGVGTCIRRFYPSFGGSYPTRESGYNELGQLCERTRSRWRD